jgi:hypothetical protein
MGQDQAVSWFWERKEQSRRGLFRRKRFFWVLYLEPHVHLTIRTASVEKKNWRNTLADVFIPKYCSPDYHNYRSERFAITYENFNEAVRDIEKIARESWTHG